MRKAWQRDRRDQQLEMRALFAALRADVQNYASQAYRPKEFVHPRELLGREDRSQIRGGVARRRQMTPKRRRQIADGIRKGIGNYFCDVIVVTSENT